MVIATGGNKRRLIAVSLRDRESKHIAIEPQCAIEIGDFQVHMANTDAGWDGI